MNYLDENDDQSRGKKRDYERLTKDRGLVAEYMRQKDINIFRTYSTTHGVFILVRRLNKESLQYVGEPGFVAKPIECKAKTATSNVIDKSYKGKKLNSQCAGLVVNPYLLRGYAFKGEGVQQADNHNIGKWGEAIQTWNKYKLPPGFEVQMDENSQYYGCVMRKTETGYRIFPRTKFNRDRAKTVNEHLVEDIPMGCSYIHGDYDLYALIHKDRMNQRSSQDGRAEDGWEHKHSKLWNDFERSVNREMDVDMIAHGSQEHFSVHSDETIDIFAPFRDPYLQIRQIIGRNGLSMLYRQFFERYTEGEKTFIADQHGIVNVVKH